jgi:ABC-type uncharacterized transport system involved in gliding motility auxiliary subunit
MDLIRQLYEVRRVDLTGDSIEDDIDILMIVHPQDLSEQMLYAIDQHILGGGEALVFLDPNADSMVTRSPQGALIPAGMSSDIAVLLDAWGVSYDASKVLTDSDLALRVRMSQNERPSPHLGMLGVQRGNLSQEDVITSRLESINVSSAGALAQAEGASTSFEPLIRSSNNAMLMDAALVENMTEPSILFDEFESQSESFVIAARVSGAINSAFPDGRPEVVEAETEEPAGDTAEETAAASSVEADNPAQPEDLAVAEEPVEAQVHIARTGAPANIVIIADSDLLSDRLWVQVAQFLGQRIPQPFANNGDFLINSLDNLSGGADLVSIAVAALTLVHLPGSWRCSVRLMTD